MLHALMYCKRNEVPPTVLNLTLELKPLSGPAQCCSEGVMVIVAQPWLLPDQ